MEFGPAAVNGVDLIKNFSFTDSQNDSADILKLWQLTDKGQEYLVYDSNIEEEGWQAFDLKDISGTHYINKRIVALTGLVPDQTGPGEIANLFGFGGPFRLGPSEETILVTGQEKGNSFEVWHVKANDWGWVSTENVKQVAIVQLAEGQEFNANMAPTNVGFAEDRITSPRAFLLDFLWSVTFNPPDEGVVFHALRTFATNILTRGISIFENGTNEIEGIPKTLYAHSNFATLKVETSSDVKWLLIKYDGDIGQIRDYKNEFFLPSLNIVVGNRNGVTIDLTSPNATNNFNPQWMTHIYGGDGDDSIVGSSFDERIRDFWGGNDTILGGGGNDRIDSGCGDDSVDGGDGNDTIIGGYGADTLDGGEGFDVFSYFWYGESDSQGRDRIKNFSFTEDTLFVTVSMRGPNPRFDVDSTKPEDPGYTLYDRGSKLIQIRTFDGTLNVELENPSNEPEYGSLKGNRALAYRIIGTDQGDFVRTGAGDDRIYAYDGDDTVYGGEGNDELWGDRGDDLIYAWEGNDRVYGGEGNDELWGGPGDDKIYAWEGNDLVDGGEGNDELYGGIGNDTLLGHGGDDKIYAWEGDDVVDGGDGNDELCGGPGDDTIYGGTGNDTLYGYDGNDLIYAEEGDDVVYGGDGNNELWGGPGDDKIYAWEGDDLVDGGEGNDELYGGTGNDTLLGHGGDDLIYAWEGDDSMEGGDGNDKLYGGPGDDTIDGGTGNDTLYGYDGNDLIYAEEGDDVVYGGDGDDELWGGPGNDTIVGGDGRDWILFMGDAVSNGLDRILDFKFGSTDGDELGFWLFFPERYEVADANSNQNDGVQAFGSNSTEAVDISRKVALVMFENVTNVDGDEIEGLFGQNKPFSLADDERAVVLAVQTGSTQVKVFYVWDDDQDENEIEITAQQVAEITLVASYSDGVATPQNFGVWS